MRALYFVAVLLLSLSLGDAADTPKKVEVRSPNEAIEFFKSKGGPEKRGERIVVPRIYYMKTARSLDGIFNKLPVDVRKELFYRGALPLILLSNEEISADRKRVLDLVERRKSGEALSSEDEAWLTYESAYGGSRFATQGNAYFGLWTWEGRGIRPKQQRQGMGDYKVAAYDNPYESVKAYAKNLNTSKAYAELRAKRAEIRSLGKPLRGPMLVDSLDRYSERRGGYVKTLKAIMRQNDLEIADMAVFADEPPVHLVEIE